MILHYAGVVKSSVRFFIANDTFQKFMCIPQLQQLFKCRYNVNFDPKKNLKNHDASTHIIFLTLLVISELSQLEYF